MLCFGRWYFRWGVYFRIPFFTAILSSDTLMKSLKYAKDQQALQRTGTGFFEEIVYHWVVCTLSKVLYNCCSCHLLCSTFSVPWCSYTCSFQFLFFPLSWIWGLIEAHSRPSLVQPNLAFLGKQPSYKRTFLQRCFLVQNSLAKLYFKSHHRLGAGGG